MACNVCRQKTVALERKGISVCGENDVNRHDKTKRGLTHFGIAEICGQPSEFAVRQAAPNEASHIYDHLNHDRS